MRWRGQISNVMEYDDVAAFAEAGKAYCGWVRDYCEVDLVAAMRILQVHLSKIHLAWAQVGPHSGELSEIEVSGEDDTPIRQKFCILPVDGYLSVFAPLDFEDEDVPVTSSLPDDVGDIFADISEGLEHWKAGRHYDAYWTWNVKYDHWGRHLVGALTVLFDYLSNSPDGTVSDRRRVWNDVPE
jgi:hypothetical protein